MDDKQFRDWLDRAEEQDTGHTGGCPAPPEIEENLIFEPIDNTVPILSISRHRIGIDGQGVNTLVVFHGCELNCKYCLNSECKGSEEGLTRYSPYSLYEAVKIDNAYFRETGGGITFGGGEPLMQSDFIRSFSGYVEEKWKIRIETSLNCDTDVFYMLYNIVDEWIIDIKSLNPDIYHAYTGGDFHKMMQMLDLMSEFSFIRKRCIIRIPIIPGFTTELDAQKTKQYFIDKGFSRFDIFTYNLSPKTEVELNRKAEVVGVEESHTSDDFDTHSTAEAAQPIEGKSKIGKLRCDFFRTLRKKIADKLNLKFTKSHECKYKGPCSGTCPACDSELKLLNDALKETNGDK